MDSKETNMCEVEIQRECSVDIPAAEEIVVEKVTSLTESSENVCLQCIIYCSGRSPCRKKTNQVEPQPQTIADGFLSEVDADSSSSISTESSEDDHLQSAICCLCSSKKRPKEEQKQDDHCVRKKIWPKEELRIKERRPQRQISLALKMLGALHREESYCWSCFISWMTVGILFLGMVSAVLGWVFNGIVNPWVEFPCFTLAVIDAILVTFYEVLELHKKRFTTKGLESFERWQYYIDSLVAELLLYPVTICSVISIAKQRTWTTDYSDPSTVTPDDCLGILDLILGSIDVITLIYIYGDRVWQIYWLMNDLHRLFNVKGQLSIMCRIVFFIASNALLFIFMTTHLFIQIYNDNLPEGDQPCKVQAYNKQMAFNDMGDKIINVIGDNVINSNSFSQNRSANLEMDDDDKICMPFLTGMMLLVTILLPPANLLVFLCVNYASFLKLLIDFNYSVTFGKDKYKEKIKGRGEKGKKIWKLVKKMEIATKTLRSEFSSLSNLQRLSLVTREWWIDVIVMLWAGLLAGYCMLFYRYYIKYVEITDWSEANNCQKAYAILYIVLFTLSISAITLANFKGLLVAAAAPIMIIPAVVGDLRKATTNDKCSETEGQYFTRESSSSNSNGTQDISHSHTSLCSQVSRNQSALFDIKPDLCNITLNFGMQTEGIVLKDGDTQTEELEQQSGTDDGTPPSRMSGLVNQSSSSHQPAQFPPIRALPKLEWHGEKSWTAWDGKAVDVTGKDYKVIIVSGSCTTCGTESEPLRLGIEAPSVRKRKKSVKRSPSSRDPKPSKGQEKREVPKTLAIGMSSYLRKI